MLPLKDHNFIDTIIQSVSKAMIKVGRVKQTGVAVKPLAISTMFHDTIIQELINANMGFTRGAGSNDLMYRGERWELKTSRTEDGCGINRINQFDAVKLVIVNALPENNQIINIRLLEARAEDFTPENPKTQIRGITEAGKRHAVKIYPL